MASGARARPWRWTAPLAIALGLTLVGVAWEGRPAARGALSTPPPGAGGPGDPLRSQDSSAPLGEAPEESQVAPGSPLPAQASSRVAIPGPRERTGLVRAARPGSERAYHESLVDLSRRDFGAFAARVDAALTGEAALPLQVAALRAWFDVGRARGMNPFLDVLQREATRLELREFALRFLAGKAQRDPGSRAVLRDYLDSRPEQARWRAEAIFAVLRWGDQEEVRDCLAPLRLELDAGVLARAQEALIQSDASSAPHVLGVVRSFLAALVSGQQAPR